MNREDRAKQFMPFDALKGLQEALRIKEFENEKTYKGDLTQEKVLEISNNLLNFDKNKEYFIKYFQNGYYFEISDYVKLNFEEKIIQINDLKIDFNDLFEFKQVDL